MTDRNVVLLHAGALGDLVLAWHFMSRLVGDPARELTIVARNPLVSWLAQRGCIRQGLRDEAVELHRMYGQAPNVHPALRTLLASADLMVNMAAGSGSALEANVAAYGAKVATVDPRPRDGRTHIVDQWVRALPEEARSAAKESVAAPAMRAGLDRPTDGRSLVIHPGSGGKSKCAPLTAFLSLARAAQDAGEAVTWMLGPVELERDGGAWDVIRGGEYGPCVVEEDVCRAAEVVARAAGFVGNDAGMSHVAALAGVPTVVWFGPTAAPVWCPLGRAVWTTQFPDTSDEELARTTLVMLQRAMNDAGPAA